VFFHADRRVHGQKDVRGEADSRFSQFCDRSEKLMENKSSIRMTYIWRFPLSVSDVEDGEITWRSWNWLDYVTSKVKWISLLRNSETVNDREKCRKVQSHVTMPTKNPCWTSVVKSSLQATWIVTWSVFHWETQKRFESWLYCRQQAKYEKCEPTMLLSMC